MVITLTNLPAEIEEALHRKAAAEGKSVDRVTLDVIARGLSVENPGQKIRDVSFPAKDGPLEPEVLQALEDQRQISRAEEERKATLQPGAKRDLSFLVGTWVEDPAFDAALEEQRQIDPELWQ
jgi:plasmid stability protein